MGYTYQYPRPSVTVDCVVFGLDLAAEDLKVLLIQRKKDPFAGLWAFPGGFVEEDETLEESAKRELQEETGISRLYLEQLYTFGDPGRDPRGHTVTVAYYALVKLSDHTPKAADDAKAVDWFSVSKPPKLAFDHAKILKMALARLRAKVRYQPIGFELLPAKFTLSQLQRLYEIVLERPLDKRNFRKKILGMGLLIDLEETQKDVAHRAAQLYRFDEERYRGLVAEGFNFEI
ncbi:MAG: Hydrolase, family [Phycisphaerales bacterium]|nr:Hydrolase, family [Phycisphaerales bacterium]